MPYFRLHEDVFLEEGARGGALYDLMRRRVIPLTPQETRILVQLECNVPVAGVEDAPSDEVRALVDRLRGDDLGRSLEAPFRLDRYLPALKLEQTGLTEPPLVFGVVHLALTASCGLGCPGCGDAGRIVWQGCNGCDRWPGVPREAAWSQRGVSELLDQLEPLDIRNVFFSGGNPAEEADLLVYALERLRQFARPPSLAVTTCGVGVEPALLDRLAELGVRLNLVLHGDGPDDYAAGGVDPAAFGAAMEAIAGAQVRSIPFSVTLRLQESWDGAVERRRQWAAGLGAKHVFVCEHLRARADEGLEPLRSLATIGPGRVPQVGPEQFFLRRERNACLSGVLAIAADGSVRPCPMIEDRALGHLGTEPLSVVLRERRHESYWQLTKDAVPGCGACEFRYACADCAAVDLAKRRTPALHAVVCAYDPARAHWRS